MNMPRSMNGERERVALTEVIQWQVEWLTKMLDERGVGDVDELLQQEIRSSFPS